jgi:hypothetical protein
MRALTRYTFRHKSNRSAQRCWRSWIAYRKGVSASGLNDAVRAIRRARGDGRHARNDGHRRASVDGRRTRDDGHDDLHGVIRTKNRGKRAAPRNTERPNRQVARIRTRTRMGYKAHSLGSQVRKSRILRGTLRPVATMSGVSPRVSDAFS